MHTFLAAPVASPAHVYGWLCLVCNEGMGFSEDDEQLVMALSGQVGRIYENGFFYGVAKRRAEELEREILKRTDAESSLRHERDRAQQYLDTAAVILLALDKAGLDPIAPDQLVTRPTQHRTGIAVDEGNPPLPEALRTAEERMRFALESAEVGIWDMDFTTGVLSCSAILESQYGLQPGTFDGTFQALVECIQTIARPSPRSSTRR